MIFSKKRLSFSILWKPIKYPSLKSLLYLNTPNSIMKVLKKSFKIVVTMGSVKKFLLMMKWKKYSEESRLNKIRWNLQKLILRQISKPECRYFMMTMINLTNNNPNKPNKHNQSSLSNKRNPYKLLLKTHLPPTKHQKFKPLSTH